MRGSTQLLSAWLWSVPHLLVLAAFLSTALSPAAAIGAGPRRLVKTPLVRLDTSVAAPGVGISVGGHEQLQWQHAERNERWQQIHRLLGPQKTSRKSQALLRAQGLGSARLADPHSWTKAPAADWTDTLRVLIVRIGFATDRSGDLTSVTTDGNFQLGPAGECDYIDPPPHDRAFFESYIFGLSEYYRLQSGGRLMIQGRVLPQGPEESYQLSDLADYGPGAGNFWDLESLERLVRDMIDAADQGSQADGSANLADFDDDDPFTYIIFVHSGADWQSDVFNDSPNDVPTFFVSLGEPQPLSSIDGDTGEPGSLSECSVIPETTTQDGFLGSIASALYHEFGHALGLVDIYSTVTGLPQVGVWDLMDSGTNLAATIGLPDCANPDSIVGVPVVGLLPPSLGAWDKWFLGWLDVATLRSGQELFRLPAVQVPRSDYPLYRDLAGYDFDEADPQAMLAGVSDREFFLIENRWVPLTADELPDTSGIGFVADQDTGVLLYMGGDRDPRTGAFRNTGMYDFFLPESGLLVWHVNTERIEPNLATNTVNAFGDGLRLVEADGIQDIGTFDAFVLGFFGSFRDPFNEDNGDVLYAEGAPSSRAYDRAWTGLSLADIGGSAASGRAVMEFAGRMDPLEEGSPFDLPALEQAEAEAMGGRAGPRALDSQSPTPLLVDGLPALVMSGAPSADWSGAAYRPKLFAFGRTGQPLAGGTLPGWPPGAVWQLDDALAGPPIELGRGSGEILLGLRHGQILSLSLNPADGFGAVLLRGPVSVGASLAFAPVRHGTDHWLCTVPPDTLRLLDEDLNTVGQAQILVDAQGLPVTGFAAAPLSIRNDAGPLSTGLAVFAEQGWFQVAIVEEGLPQADLESPVFHPYSRRDDGALWRALIPGDSGATLLVFPARGTVDAWTIAADGSVISLAWRGELEEGPVCEPAVADVDADGRHDLVVATPSRIHAWQADGLRLTGFPVQLAELFPLPDSTRIAGPVVVCDTGGDGVNEILFATDQGHLLGLGAQGELLARTPFLWGTGRGGSLAVGDGAGPGERILWLLESAGRRGPPLYRRWYNGRASGYRLQQGTAAGQRTSEWLGAAGGGDRGGVQGTAAALAGATPWLAEQERVLMYPNPLQADDMTLRFYSQTDRQAQLIIYNLEGEEVMRRGLVTSAGQINEFRLSLPGLASGLYVCRLEHETARGVRSSVNTLAVER